nr:MAG TPA: hypothetical protein [Caudoviricetes sp.]
MKNNNYPTWLVPIEIAKELKEIGFKEKCLCYWHEYFHRIECSTDDEDRLCPEYYDYNTDESTTSLPTWEQVFEWFREKGYESYIRLESHAHFDEGNYYYFEITKSNLCQLDWQGDFDDYNEAREALVKALIRTYKNEQL